VLGIILGGGAGTRLYPLTKKRAKPAVPLVSTPAARATRPRRAPAPCLHARACHALRCARIGARWGAGYASTGVRACAQPTQALTTSRACPLVARAAASQGGNYRLIDIPVSNCINSEIVKIYCLTQFNSASLNRHLSSAYVRARHTRFWVACKTAAPRWEHPPAPPAR
jgi:hypothetical protein